ncbi:MAG TPA: hypothetical protein VG269_26960 [Tepidisphaeraceae bacterium]|jgi:hypothetical protein|nr:hypothetical protein [Tepidisphaeraceae bacterium]
MPLLSMPRTTTRVQLNGRPSDEDYKTLHTAMKKKRFSRFITGSDGTIYHLPHAEYNREDDGTMAQVLADAKAAAAFWADHQILVTEGSRTWWKLKKATADEVAAG